MTIEILYKGKVIKTVELPEVERIKDLQLCARMKSKVDNIVVGHEVNLYDLEKELEKVATLKSYRPKRKWHGGTVPRPILVSNSDGSVAGVFKSTVFAANFLKTTDASVRTAINHGKIYKKKYRVQYADQ